jgi:hypothetical protein
MRTHGEPPGTSCLCELRHPTGWLAHLPQPRLHFIVSRLTPRPITSKLTSLALLGPISSLEQSNLWGAIVVLFHALF